ncbi:nocturnin [Aplochiton taeniatus]
MYPARRCSYLLNRDLAALCISPRGQTGGKKVPQKALAVLVPRHCHGGVGGDGIGTKPQTRTSGGASSPKLPTARPTVCPMGSNSSSSATSSSNSRLFGTLALSSATMAQPDPYPDQDQDPDQEQDVQSLADPDQLLRECGDALRNRPARPHRDLVHPSSPLDQKRHQNHLQQPSIRVMQWNILAQALGEGKDGFVRCPLDALNWSERKYLILEEILTHRPDVLCLQEVDHYYDTFQPVLASLGYHGSFLAKPWSPCLDVERNNGPDGCALFYRRSRFSLLATAHLRLSALLLPTNQVAIAMTLRCRATGRRLCVAVTHLKARSGWERLRSAQGADLLSRLKGITAGAAEGASGGAEGGCVPLIVCGDFNAEPTEEVYRRFRTSPLGLDSAYRLLSFDGQTEPAFTTWKIRPSGESCSTLDYIWYTREALAVETLLDLPSEEQIGPDRLPSYHYPSDHLSLLADISFREQSHRLM